MCYPTTISNSITNCLKSIQKTDLKELKKYLEQLEKNPNYEGKND